MLLEYIGLALNMVKTIRFVAIGNSLTVGFTPSSFSESNSYPEFVKEITDDFLKQSGKNSTLDVKFRNMGINGDLTSGMLIRFKKDVIDLKPKYVIILGGTNDLGWGFLVEEIFTNLKKMIETAKDNKIQPIGCTIPSVLGWDEGIPARLQLNKLLKHYCREKEILCVNLFLKTSDPKTKRLKSKYSLDGLHLNISGYRKIAETIFEEAVRDIILRELALAQLTNQTTQS